ncbi:MAG: PAS-domain containing protein [Pseudomonadota bacterium]
MAEGLATKNTNSESAFEGLLTQSDNKAALAVFQNAFDAMEDGVALWDEDLKFVLCNERYYELTLPPGVPRFKPGDCAKALGAEVFSKDFFVVPEGTDPARMVDQMVKTMKSFVVDLELERTDGTTLSISSKKTTLGGYLLTFKDVTDRKRAEAAERTEAEASELVQKVVEACPANFLMSRVETGEVLFRSNASQELFGEKESARGHWYNPDDRKRYLAKLEKDGRVDDMFVLGLKEDGTPFPSQVSARMVDYQGEKVIVSSTTDLTEAFALRDERDRANAQLREAVEALDESFVLFDENNEQVVANARHRKLLEPYNDLIKTGTKLGDVRRKAVEDGYLKVKCDAPGGLDQALKALQPNQTVNFEMTPADGTRWTARMVRLKSGATVGTALDITEQLQAERLFADAIENLPICVAVESEDSKITHCNATYRAFYGVPLETLKTLTFEERMKIIYDKLEALDGKPVVGHPLEAHRETHVSTEAKFKDGRQFLFERAPAQNNQTVIVITEITQLKLAEERRLASINDAIEGSGEALVLFDKDARFVLGNKAYHEMFWTEIEAPYVGEPVETLFQRVIDHDYYALPDGMTKEQFYEAGLDVFYNHGKDLPMDTASGRRVFASSHQTGLDGYLLSFKDMTDQIKAEMLFADAIGRLPVGVAVETPTGELTHCNAAFASFYDSRVEELTAMSFEERMAVIYPKVETVNGQPVGDDPLQFHRDSQETQRDSLAPIEAKFKEGRHYLLERAPTYGGGRVVVMTDITKLKQAEAELQEQRETSHQNEKLSALGELLAGVAHELNNPLSVVFGYAQMLQGKVDDPVISERIGFIGQSAERAAKIVKTFLAMARQRPTKIELCSLNEAVRTALDVSSYGLKANGTRVLIELDDEAPLVSGDFDQLAQVFSNLIVNAGHALEEKRDRGELVVRSYFDASSDQTVIEVRDNGVGIPKDIQSRIFEPFFTTKDVGEGTGVGLAFSHRIIENHDGELSVRSEVGKGTSFYVKLRSAVGTRVQDQETDDGPEKSGQHSVLVVDDEAGVAQLIHDILVEHGFTVTKTTSPRDALAILENQTFDAVLSDFKMPDMDGEHFYNAMKVIAPECADRIGFVTGDSMSRNVRQFFLGSKRPYLEKPIITDELLVLVGHLCEPDRDLG